VSVVSLLALTIVLLSIATKKEKKKPEERLKKMERELMEMKKESTDFCLNVIRRLNILEAKMLHLWKDYGAWADEDSK